VSVTVTDSSSAGTLADGRTRDRVVRLLLEGGPATAASLAEQLGLSPAAVRRHLEALVAGGTATSGMSRPTGTRGRPARTYRLTEAGHAGLQTAYDDLAAAALRYLADTGGRAAVGSFAAARSAELERRVRESMGDRAGAAPAERAPALARALTAHGYAASTSATATGSAQLCQHHCPVQAVAAQFPELCEAETAALGRLLGTHVQRLATLAHGDGVCTTHVPAPGPPTAPGPLTGKIPARGRRSTPQGTDAAARTDSPAPASPQLRRTTA
jgi:predicted ArsR family transcriptional regulator